MTIEDFDAVLYVDGEEVSRNSTYNVEPRMLLETTMNYLGKSRKDDHNLFDGKFDDFKIFNRALTSEEVSVLADEEIEESPVDPIENELILDYDMTNIEGTKIKDSTGNFDGTLVNPEDAEIISDGSIGVVSLGGENTH